MPPAVTPPKSPAPAFILDVTATAPAFESGIDADLQVALTAPPTLDVRAAILDRNDPPYICYLVAVRASSYSDAVTLARSRVAPLSARYRRWQIKVTPLLSRDVA